MINFELKRWLIARIFLYLHIILTRNAQIRYNPKECRVEVLTKLKLYKE